MVVINWDNYADAIKMISGQPYVTVAGQIRAAHDQGLLLGIQTEFSETEQVYRVKATVRILNREFLSGGEYNFPEDTFDKIMVQEYTGYAEWPKAGATGPGKSARSPDNLFPIETLETSAVGRALTKAGFSIMTSSATADEMELIDDKQEVGNGHSQSDTVDSPRDAVAKKLRQKGYTTQKKVNDLTQAQFKADFPDLTARQLFDLDKFLNQPTTQPF